MNAEKFDKKPVVKRAKEIVEALEAQDGNQVKVSNIRSNVTQTQDEGQMNFFGAADSPVLEELKELDLNTMTPVEALTKLYDLQAKAKN